MNRIGYCCIAIGCNEGKKKKDHITVNRGMVRRTFDAKGLPYVSELIIDNLKDKIEMQMLVKTMEQVKKNSENMSISQKNNVENMV